MADRETINITVGKDQILSNIVWDAGEYITVSALGTVSDVSLTHNAAGVTLEDGATISKGFSVAAPVTTLGDVNAAEADIVWNISRLKQEDGLLFDDYSSVNEAKSWTICVNPNQDKGTYQLIGNAASFDKTITVTDSSGGVLGELSLATAESRVLNFDITRYTLDLKDGVLTVTISSNITNEVSYVFLYKNNQLVEHHKELDGVTVSSSGDFAHLVLIEKGRAGNIKLMSGGVVTVYAGAAAVGIEQGSSGKLRFDYSAGDSTVITGVNQYGTFFVENNKLYNVVGENVALSGALSVVDYRSVGAFTAEDGVDISGIFVSGSSSTFRKGTRIHDCSVTGSNLNFEAGVTVTDTTIGGGYYHYFRGGTFSNVTFSGSYNVFYGGTYSNVTLSSGNFYGHTSLTGTLTVKGTLNVGSLIDAKGNTIVLDYTKRKIADGNIMNGAYVSEDAVFRIMLLADQSIGTFSILGSSDKRTKYKFDIEIEGIIIGSLSETNTSFAHGSFVYTMTSGKALEISLSADADETYNVLFWDQNKIFGHAKDLFTASASSSGYQEIKVRAQGKIGDITLDSGGRIILERGASAVGLNHKNNAALQFDYSAGDSTVISGVNQYGTFVVDDDTLINVVGEKVALSGALTVENYYSTGDFSANNGVAFSGVISVTSGSATFGSSGAAVTISKASVSGGGSKYFDNVFVTDTTFSGSNTFFRSGGFYDNITVSGGVFEGGTFSDSTWYGGTLAGTVYLEGTLNLKGNLSFSSGSINAAGNTIVLDYTQCAVGNTTAMVAVNYIDDVVFDILLRDEQTVGKYLIASGAGSFIDTFNIVVDGVTIGTLNNANSKLEKEGTNFAYSMTWENQKLYLSIGVSEFADENFNILCYDSNKRLTYAQEMTGLVIDGSSCASVTVRGGHFANAKLNNGTVEVEEGAYVYGMEQGSNGRLHFNYSAGDSTVITGVNQYGTFFVEDNHILNVVGQNVTVNGDVTVENYHVVGFFTGTGITVTGSFSGSGTFNSATFTDAVVSGTATVSDASYASDTTFSSVNISGGSFENITINGSATLSGGTYSEVTINGNLNVRGAIELDGGLYLKGGSNSLHHGINAAGHEVNLDLTQRTTESGTMINLDKLYNADLTFTVYANQTLGTYAIGSNAGSIGSKENEGVWDPETNTWLYTGEIKGDLDGIITIRSADGIELARCTVNGDTEYFGRYNYRVYTDGNILRLRIGWNNKEDITFADDGYNNNTLKTATVVAGSGVQTLPGRLSIHDSKDEDWFKFTLERTGTAASNVTISFKQWAGDLDMDIFDKDGKRITYAHSVTDDETISLQGFEAGEYYIRVYGDEGETNSYSLNLNLPVMPDLNDIYEKGNTAKSAYHLGEITSDVSFHGALSEAGDEDFFTFTLNRSGMAADSITLNFDPELGDLDLYLYDGKGKTLLSKSVSASGGSETLSFKGLAKGAYMLRVVAKNGEDIADYDLDFTLRGNEVKPDKYENNNTLKKAKNLYALNGKDQNKNLSIHSADDVDYFKFKLKETGTADDWIAIDYEAAMGDLDIEILDEKGKVVRSSKTTENTDKVSLAGLKKGNYYIRVRGYNGVTNTYDMSWSVNNSALIASDNYEGVEPVVIAQDQTISGLTIATPQKNDETHADVFAIQLEYVGWNSSKIILSGFRSDWEEGMAWKLSSDAAGKDIIASGIGSEISLAGLAKGTWYLTVDSPVENQNSEYTLVARNIPDGPVEQEKNSWSIFIYMAGDNNLESAYLNELLWMQQAILPAGVEVYVLMDRSDGFTDAERNWSDTRVGKIVHSSGSAVAVQWLYFNGTETDTYVDSSNQDLRKEWDTGNVATLEAFLDWGMKTGKADNYALIMKDHGSSLGFNSSDEKTKDGDSENGEENRSIMNISDIANLLGQEKYNDLNVVAFDQCLMGSDVVVTTLEGTVDYVVASEATGWTPNQLVMYKVLFNSLSAGMTPQELAQKIVRACNSSGILDLTSASFHVADSTMSEALNQFAAAASGFTRADWAAVCRSFAMAYNYGDSICAYSDLGFILNAIKNSQGISDTLLAETETLYEIVFGDIIDTTMIVPASYGTGFAVFNPIKSSDLMNYYSYGPGAELDYYGTAIGQNDWGTFMYTVGVLGSAFTEYFVENRTQFTFTDFSYTFADDAVQINYNLGEFYGDGVEYRGLYLQDNLYFTITLDNIGRAGDAIKVIADNPDANITITLIQQLPTWNGIELITRRVSEDGVLSLEGIDNDNAGVLTQYFLTISTDQETNCDLIFDALWTSGSDYFDYSRSGNQLGGQGNGTIEKATVLSAGKYGGLVTWQGDPDYYRLNSVYANEIEVVITGSGLVVCEYNEKGELVRTATEKDGKYFITVTNGNYLYVEGTGVLEAGKVNSYTMEISDTADTYLDPDDENLVFPDLVVTSYREGEHVREVILTPQVAEGIEVYYTTAGNIRNWTLLTGDHYVATSNDMYVFKAVDPSTGLEHEEPVDVEGIDSEPPEIPEVSSDIPQNQITRGNVTVSVNFSEDSARREFSRDGENWEEYTGEIVVEENCTLYFRGFDLAGNESEVMKYEVRNIDKDKPGIEVLGNPAAWTNKSITLTVTSNEEATFRYKVAGKDWQEGYSIQVDENCTIELEVEDEAGNIQAETVVVSMIDKDVPELTVEGNPEEWTNDDVILTLTGSEANVTFEYSYDQLEWFVVPQETSPIALLALDESFEELPSVTFTVTENKTVYFRTVDKAKNVSEVQTVVVEKIDKSAPSLTIEGNPVEWTNKKVVLKATADDPRGCWVYYKKAGEAEFIESPEEITVSENGVYVFYAEDGLGNRSAEIEIPVTKIDTDAPVLNVAGNLTSWSKDDLTLTLTSNEEGTFEYSFDGNEWQSGFKVRVEQNCTLYLKVTDRAKNVTTRTLEITNIDKVLPVITVEGNPVEWTNAEKVIISAESSEEGILEYSTDGDSWAEGSEVEVTENGTLYFRATDKAGNVTTEKVVIDKFDRDCPVLEISGVPTEWTNESVTLTADANETVTFEFSYDNATWQEGAEVTVDENKVVYFRVTDRAENVTTQEILIDKIDKTPPALNISGIPENWTNKDVTLEFTSDEEGLFEYSFDNITWYQGAVAVVPENRTVYLKVTDRAKNVTTQTVVIDLIDKEMPSLTIEGNVSEWVREKITLTASSTEEDVTYRYSYDNTLWHEGNEVLVNENITVYFQVEDKAGNIVEYAEKVEFIDLYAPGVPVDSSIWEDGENAIIIWESVADNGNSGVSKYELRYGRQSNLVGSTIISCTGNEYTLEDPGIGLWYYQIRAVDKADNKSEWSAVQSFTVYPVPTSLAGDCYGVTWENVEGVTTYVLEYSTDNFKTVLSVTVAGGTGSSGLDFYSLPSEDIQWRVRASGGARWSRVQTIENSGNTENSENVNLVSGTNGSCDLFFAVTRLTWGEGFAAKHLGNADWEGTGNEVLLEGKNRFTDTFKGAEDSNVLVLTDDANGDSLFVDDIFSALGKQSRMKEIDEIRAGAGADIVDMTSQRFRYVGSTITIYGGSGDDVLWGGAERNILFGDEGNDELAGSSGNDILMGGSGDDTMYGGGGEDIFSFGGNWGSDTVIQLADGKVTLYFENGSVIWSEDDRSFTDGVNSVTVIGTSDITVKYGNDGLLPNGAFAEAVTWKIFEESAAEAQLA